MVVVLVVLVVKGEGEGHLVVMFLPHLLLPPPLLLLLRLCRLVMIKILPLLVVVLELWENVLTTNAW